MPIKEPRLTNLQIQTSEDILYSLVDEVNAGTIGTAVDAVDSGMRIKDQYDSDVDFYERKTSARLAEEARVAEQARQSGMRVDLFSELAANEEKTFGNAAGDMVGIEERYKALSSNKDLLSLQKSLQSIDAKSSQSLHYTDAQGEMEKQAILRRWLAAHPDDGELIMGVASRFSKTSYLDTAIDLSIETAKRLETEAAAQEGNALKWAESAGMDMGEYYTNPEAFWAKFPAATQRHAAVQVAKQNLATMKANKFYNEQAFLSQAQIIAPNLAVEWQAGVEAQLGTSIDQANQNIIDGIPDPVPGMTHIQNADQLKQYLAQAAEVFKLNTTAQYSNASVAPDTFQSILKPFDSYVGALTTGIGTKQQADAAKNLSEIAVYRKMGEFDGSDDLLAIGKMLGPNNQNPGVQRVQKEMIGEYISFIDSNRAAKDYDTPVDLDKAAASSGVKKEDRPLFVTETGRKVVTAFKSPDFNIDSPAEVQNVVGTLYAYATDANKRTTAKQNPTMQNPDHAQIWIDLAVDPKFKTLYDTKLTVEEQSQIRPQLVAALNTELLYITSNQATSKIQEILNTRMTGFNLNYKRYGGVRIIDKTQPETLPSPLARDSDAVPNTISNVERHVQIRRLIGVEVVDNEIQFVVRPSDQTGVELDTASANKMREITNELNTEFGPSMNKLGQAMDNVTPNSKGRQQIVDGINNAVRGYE